MKKIKILISVYNDWESLVKLLNEINKEEVMSDLRNWVDDTLAGFSEAATWM